MNVKPVAVKSTVQQIIPAKYKEIKYLPKLRCACCYGKMIQPQDLQKAFTAVSKPLAKMIEKGVFEYWEYQPKIWSILLSFAEKFPKFSLDKILIDKENRVALKKAVLEKVYEDKTIPQDISKADREYLIDNKLLNDYGDILNRSRDTLRGAGVVMKRMARFKECLKGEKLATFEQLERYAEKYPRKTLREIINMDEIYKFHQTKDLLQRAESREKLDYHFHNIEKLLKKVDPKSEEMFNELKEEVLELFDTCRDEDARIYRAKQIFQKAISKYNDKKLEKKVFAELEQIPTSFITKDSFLVYAKNHDYGDARIISSLLIPSEVSFEHIVPRIDSGENHATNGIVFCRDCNQKRASIPYEEFVQYHPRMPYNVQKQVRMISNYILEGRLDDVYRFWPIRVSETLKEYSKGTINPDVSNYVKKALAKSAQIVEMNNAELVAIKKERDAKFKEKEELLKQLEKVNSQLCDLKEERNQIQELNKIEQTLTDTLNEYIESRNS